MSLGSFLRGAGTIAGTAFGGPVGGALAGAAINGFGGGRTAGASPPGPAGPSGFDFGYQVKAGPLSFGLNFGTKPGAGGTCPKGYHLNKHPLAASKHHGAVPARSMCVRNRRVNPLNSRALSRSLRRLHRAQKLVRKLHVLPPVHKRKS